jgi:hypothetical protein
VIHTVRDPERWYNSTYETIYQGPYIFPRWLQKMVKPIGRVFEMQQRLIWQNLFEDSFEDRQWAIEIFRQRTKEVERVSGQSLAHLRCERGLGAVVSLPRRAGSRYAFPAR